VTALVSLAALDRRIVGTRAARSSPSAADPQRAVYDNIAIEGYDPLPAITATVAA